jgi:hypothetical protein
MSTKQNTTIRLLKDYATMASVEIRQMPDFCGKQNIVGNVEVLISSMAAKAH